VPVILWNTHIVEQERKSVETFWMVGKEVKNPPILLDVDLGVGFKAWITSGNLMNSGK
jgi:hypothetical protein